jgi:FkbM family methyltransferase
MLTKEDVVWAYRLYLFREPENEQVVNNLITNCRDRKELGKSLRSSIEYKKKNDEIAIIPPNPFWHYLAAFDAIEVINSHAKKQLASSPFHVTNFLGVKTRPEFYPKLLTNKVGTVEPVPIPANWHADIAEWASCLRSVDLSGDRFTMLELGCGWGCWINNLGVAAKSAGKKIKLYGIEGDKESIRFAQLAVTDNGITKNEVILSHGIAGKAGSIALFPVKGSEGGGGGVAIFNPDSQQLSVAIESGKYVNMPVIDIENLIKNEKILDFLHVDIQGAELEVLTEMIDLLCAKVRYIFIGTHSKQIEGGLFDLFMNKGSWKLEVERPAVFVLVNEKPIVKVDGVQAWRNSKIN